MALDTKTKKSMAGLALILIAAMGFRFVFVAGVQKKRMISSKARQANEKIALLASIGSLNDEIAGYEKLVAKKATQSGLTDRVASLSRGLNIKVISVTPQPKDDYGEYIKLNMSLELEGAYPEVMKFLRRLESDELFMMVHTVEIKSSYTPMTRWGGIYTMPQPGARRFDEPPKITMVVSTLYKK